MNLQFCCKEALSHTFYWPSVLKVGSQKWKKIGMLHLLKLLQGFQLHSGKDGNLINNICWNEGAHWEVGCYPCFRRLHYKYWFTWTWYNRKGWHESPIADVISENDLTSFICAERIPLYMVCSCSSTVSSPLSWLEVDSVGGKIWLTLCFILVSSEDSVIK